MSKERREGGMKAAIDMKRVRHASRGVFGGRVSVTFDRDLP